MLAFKDNEIHHKVIFSNAIKEHEKRFLRIRWELLQYAVKPPIWNSV